MLKITKQVVSKHSCEKLYDLVNDTESYCLFVPFCKDSQVIMEEGAEKECMLIFAKGPIEQKLFTRNILEPHKSIEIFLNNGPFSHLYGRWHFEEVLEGTKVTLYIEYAFKHSFVEYTFGQFFRPLSQELVQIFCERADEVSIY